MVSFFDFTNRLTDLYLGLHDTIPTHLLFQIEESSDSVETLHISANEAFGKFKGKNLDTANVDFSDKIRKSKQKG